MPDTSLVPGHPAVKVRMQQQQVALLDIALQKAKLLPQLSLGYINQSFRGVQLINGVEKTYTAGHRFSSVVVGVAIPVFAQSLKARIAASRQHYLLSQSEYQEALRQQKTAFEQLLLQYHKNEKQLRYYEQYALKQAKILREHSTLQLNSGAISYIEWMLLVHQSIQLEADYFAVLNDWNTTVIELNAYINN
jgi:heavy metal efflux system protein